MMNKEKALDEVKDILTKKGIEFKVGMMGNTITAKVGRIVQWFHFTESSIAVISHAIVGMEIIETSHINTEYEDIEDFCLSKGDLWIREKGFGYTVISLQKDN